MRSLMIKITALRGYHAAGVAQGIKQVFVQAFVAEPAVEQFDQTVLHRLAWRDEMPFDLAIPAPLEDGVRGQLGAGGQLP